MLPDDAVIARMQELIHHWETRSDPRAIFLRCYCMMTGNMLAAVRRGEFNDPTWVEQLLNHFAGYYFAALEDYQRAPAQAPTVWQVALDSDRCVRFTALQNLLLGVNAHINYDLVFALVDLLQPEWTLLTEEQRAARYADHCRVNQVIGQTIDAVQDQVLVPVMSVVGLIDRLLGPMDELLISQIISGWRETVWQNAVRLLELQDENERLRFRQTVEEEAVQLGDIICG